MANSPLPDADVLKTPQASPPEKEANAWEKLGKSKNFKDINDYLEQRKKFYRDFLPDGTPIENATDAQIAAHYRSAAIVLKEIEAFQGAVALNTRG